MDRGRRTVHELHPCLRDCGRGSATRWAGRRFVTAVDNSLT